MQRWLSSLLGRLLGDRIYQAGNPTFFDRHFLVLAALLGLTCTVTYAVTHSLLLITLIHWIVVVVWLWQFGGMARLESTSRPLAPNSEGTI